MLVIECRENCPCRPEARIAPRTSHEQTGIAVCYKLYKPKTLRFLTLNDGRLNGKHFFPDMRAAFGGEIQIPRTTSSARPTIVQVPSPVPCQVSRVLHAGAKKNPCKGKAAKSLAKQHTASILNWRSSSFLKL